MPSWPERTEKSPRNVPHQCTAPINLDSHYVSCTTTATAVVDNPDPDLTTPARAIMCWKCAEFWKTQGWKIVGSHHNRDYYNALCAARLQYEQAKTVAEQNAVDWPKPTAVPQAGRYLLGKLPIMIWYNAKGTLLCKSGRASIEDEADIYQRWRECCTIPLYVDEYNTLLEAIPEAPPTSDDQERPNTQQEDEKLDTPEDVKKVLDGYRERAQKLLEVTYDPKARASVFKDDETAAAALTLINLLLGHDKAPAAIVAKKMYEDEVKPLDKKAKDCRDGWRDYVLSLQTGKNIGLKAQLGVAFDAYETAKRLSAREEERRLAAIEARKHADEVAATIKANADAAAAALATDSPPPPPLPPPPAPVAPTVVVSSVVPEVGRRAGVKSKPRVTGCKLAEDDFAHDDVWKVIRTHGDTIPLVVAILEKMRAAKVHIPDGIAIITETWGR